MKNSIIKFSLFGLISVCLTGCALGSATSAYAVTARNLDNEAEARIVARAKAETISELSKNGQLKTAEKIS